jgi:dihydrofolate reductase
MRKLKIIEHISLDGVMQSTGEDNFPYANWTASYRTPEGFAMVLEAFGDKFDLLLGRTTYNQWSTFWPTALQNPMGDRFNSATKYVVTHRPESLEWGPSQALNGNIVESIRALKLTSGPDLVLGGSSTLVSTLIEHGLADELLLLVYPVLLGTGKKFFHEGIQARAFKFESTKTSPTGILINQYKFIGPLQS